ncbi:hypothetical protein LTR42_012437 [Elasticomyces elasticus]|nr:hypothetical protein LTR42_012437 [Elasticomyces elasticus]
MATSGVVEVDPNGDVFLLCGEPDNEVRSFRVSSYVLRLASSVFQALLGPRFREGNELATSATVEIPLPEDKPEDMEILCSILHMRHDQAASVLGTKTIMGFAMLCDKYGCAKAVQPSVELWVRDHLEAAKSYDLTNYLRAVSLLGYQDSARRVGANLIKEAAGSIVSLVAPDNPRLMSLCAALEDLRTGYRQKLKFIVEDEVDNVLIDKRNGACNAECPVHLERLGSFMEQLRHERLWPCSKQSVCLDDALTAIQDFQAREPDDLVDCHPTNCVKSMGTSLTEISRDLSRRALNFRKQVNRFDSIQLKGW